MTESSDLPLAAFIAARGVPVSGTRLDGRRVHFRFRLTPEEFARLYHLADCGHLVRGPEGEPCPICEPFAVSVEEMERWGIVESCPDTDPAPADEERDLQELLDAWTAGDLPK